MGATDELSDYDVEVHDLVHYYGDSKVLDCVDLQIKKGEFFSILGPSGSGKTTTLRIIGGFVKPTQGSIYIQDELVTDVPPYRRNTTTVFQHLALFPHMTVFKNVAYGLRLRNRPKQEIKERVQNVLRLVKLEGFEQRYPKQLSGGQQQRIALARAIILEPSVVLFDEPLGSLDLKLRREMQVELKNLQKAVGTTFIYVTHDQEEALTMSDRIAVMNEGRIEQIGTAEEVYERPKTRFVADFIGDTNLLDGRVIAVDGLTVTVEADGLEIQAQANTPMSAGDSITISIRPESVSLYPHASTQVGNLATIQDIIYTGSTRRFIVQLRNGHQLRVDSPSGNSTELKVGDMVRVGWTSDRARGIQ